MDSFAWPEGYRPPCPVCGQVTTGIADVQALTGDRLVIMAEADPCGCEVNQHAARLQAGAVAPVEPIPAAEPVPPTRPTLAAQPLPAAQPAPMTRPARDRARGANGTEPETLF